MLIEDVVHHNEVEVVLAEELEYVEESPVIWLRNWKQFDPLQIIRSLYFSNYQK